MRSITDMRSALRSNAATRSLTRASVGLAMAYAVFVMGSLSTAALAQSSTNASPPVQGEKGEPASAVVLLYHRFGDQSVPSGNIQIEQFEAHLAEIQAGGYTVLPLADIVSSLKSDTKLPDRSLAITIDTTHVSVFDEAWPRLRALGYPFTVFVASDLVDTNRRDVMSWDQIRTLHKDGATIAALGASYTNLVDRPPEKVAADILRARRRIADEITATPKFFAYPFGVYGQDVKSLVRDAGFDAAFGQHSGAANALDDIFALPRFSMTEAYGSLERFRLVADTLPLPTVDFTPDTPVLTKRNPPNIGFTVSDRITMPKNITCFASRQGKVSVEVLPAGRVEVRLPGPFAEGRARLNCTAIESGRWRWFGRQFYVPSAE